MRFAWRTASLFEQRPERNSDIDAALRRASLPIYAAQPDPGEPSGGMTD